MKEKLLPSLMLFFLAIGLFPTSSLPVDVPMMTKDELKSMLKNPDLVILDIRLSSDYFSSDLKIEGANRPDEGTRNIVHPQYSGKTIVIYSGSMSEGFAVGNAQILIGRGYKKVYVLKGGWEEWHKAGYPTEKK